VHLVRNSLRYVSWKQRKQAARDLKLIYQAATAEEAQRQLDRFAARWDHAYPRIGQIWQRNREHIIPFFAYPAEIRKVIYTTSAVEAVNRSLRKVIMPRGSFPSDEAALKLLYLALKGIRRKWTRPVADWRAALNRFAILVEDRVPVTLRG